MKIVEYKTLIPFKAGDLDEWVNEYIADGWQPYGYRNDGKQVMVKYEEPPSKLDILTEAKKSYVPPSKRVGNDMIPKPWMMPNKGDSMGNSI